jgi:hypothetical protein
MPKDLKQIRHEQDAQDGQDKSGERRNTFVVLDSSAVVVSLLSG